MEFISEMDLVDVPRLGTYFTWFNGDGTSMSILDRFILSGYLINSWKIIGQAVEKRDISDDCLIRLKSSDLNWGTKPFKFNKC